MNTVVILPNQLFEHNELIKPSSIVYLIEHPKYFTQFKYHKLKLILHRATMKYYYDYLKQHYNNKIYYIDINQKIKFSKNDMCVMYDPVDHQIVKEYKKYNTTFYNTPLFLLSNNDVISYAKNKTKFQHDAFYKWIRKHNNILMNKSVPVGNVWSYDTENRQPFPKKIKNSYEPKTISNKYVIEATKYANKHFPTNPGSDELYVPITHDDTKKHFKTFLKTRLKNFGPYQDAVDIDITVGYHSLLSPLLNVGLLLPTDVITITEKYGRKHKIPMNSLEGFIRQICGWREYVRMLYVVKSKELVNNNFFNHKKQLANYWFSGRNIDTGFVFIDQLVQKTFDYSYLHHIERLMYIGNFMLLTQTDPKNVYAWFISICSIDAYEWVMVPNIYGMSQHSAGDIMMGRPYFSSSNYINKMSWYKKSTDTITLNGAEYDWNIVYDALYYNFINNNKVYLASNYATAMQVKHWNNKSKEEQKNILKITKQYFKEY